jgi:hypothetical protein
MRDYEFFLEEVVECFVSCAILFPLGILGYQSYIFFRYGSWPPRSVIWLLDFMEMPWAKYPTDWLGLHHIFDMIPLSLFLFGVFVLVAVFVAGICESIREK